MDGGVIANRYATAFMEYVRRHGNVEQVRGQVRLILGAMSRVHKFNVLVSRQHGISVEEKIGLLADAVAPAKLHPDIEHFFRFMDSRLRVEYFRLALLDFLTLYLKMDNKCMVQLTTVNAADEGLMNTVDALVREKTGKTPVIVAKADPDIIGGFVLESWGYRLDASVRTALENSCKQLSKKTKRIV